MRTNEAGIAIIKKWESFMAKPYLCPAGVPTIGYGSTFYPNGTKVTMKDKAITKEEAHQLLVNALVKTFEPEVDKAVVNEINDNQFSALVSFTYNMGIGNLKESTLLKKVNAGDYLGASKEFKRWNKARVKGVLQVLAGLTSRRKDEAELFVRI